MLCKYRLQHLRELSIQDFLLETPKERKDKRKKATWNNLKCRHTSSQTVHAASHKPVKDQSLPYPTASGGTGMPSIR